MKELAYEEFIQELKSYAYDSIDDALAAITEDGDFNRLEALLFIVHYKGKDKISKEVYNQLSSLPKIYFDLIIKDILSENNVFNSFEHDEDENPHNIDD